MSQKIRIKLKSYDHKLVDKSAEKIVKAVKATGAIISGPIPLPTHKRIYTVNRSTFVNKKSREQFQLSDYKRLIDIYSSTAKTVDALMKLELPSGVEVEIKVTFPSVGDVACFFSDFDTLIWAPSQMRAYVLFLLNYFLHTFAPRNYKSHG